MLPPLLCSSADMLSLLSSAEVAVVLQHLSSSDRLAAAATCRHMLRDALQPLSCSALCPASPASACGAALSQLQVRSLAHCRELLDHVLAERIRAFFSSLHALSALQLFQRGNSTFPLSSTISSSRALAMLTRRDRV